MIFEIVRLTELQTAIIIATALYSTALPVSKYFLLFLNVKIALHVVCQVTVLIFQVWMPALSFSFTNDETHKI